MRALVALVLAVCALSSCTNEQVYDSARDGERLKCDRLPYGQREECLKNIAPDYRVYEEERKKLKKNK